MTAYGGGKVENDGNNTTVTFDEGQTLVYAEDSNAYGRTAQCWWAGIHIDMPEGVNREEGKTTFQKIEKWWEDDGEKEDWMAAKIVEEDGQYWAMVRPTYMNAYKGADEQLMYRYAFDWDGDGENDQYVTIIVKDNVKFAEHPYVKASDGDKCGLCGEDQSDSGHTNASSPTPQPILGSVTAYGGGKVENDGNNTTVTFDEGQTLVYAEDSNAYGRTAQCWWAGIHIDMPKGVNREEGKTTFQKIEKWWEDDGEKEDWMAAKIVEEDGQYWALVRPTYMNAYKGDDKQLMYRYAFNWDGDEKNDQYVTIIVKDNVKFAEHPYVKASDGDKCGLCGEKQSDSGHTNASSEDDDDETNSDDEEIN